MIQTITNYNPQDNIPATKWVSEQALSVGAIDYSIFSDESWGENIGLLDSHILEEGRICFTDLVSLRFFNTYILCETNLVEYLSSLEVEYWIESMNKEIVNLEKQKTWDVI